MGVIVFMKKKKSMKSGRMGLIIIDRHLLVFQLTLSKLIVCVPL